jgi:hypothetical protein
MEMEMSGSTGLLERFDKFGTEDFTENGETFSGAGIASCPRAHDPPDAFCGSRSSLAVSTRQLRAASRNKETPA